MLKALAPGKVNLSLFVGAPREDGLHPLVSVVQPVTLADELTLGPAGGADADEVRCPGIDGPNLAGRALAFFREATGWDAPPQRLTIVKRVPVAAGMGGGSADAAGALRLAAYAAGGAPGELLHELAVALGADVPALLAGGRVLMTGAGEHVERLPEPEPFGLVLVPSPAGLSTPEVYRAFDRHGVDLAAQPSSTRGQLPRAPASRRRASTTSRPPRASCARPSSDPLGRPACRGRRSRHGLGLRPDGLRPVSDARRRPRRGGGRRRRGRRACRSRLRGGRPGMKWSWLLGAVAVAAFLLARRHRLGRWTQAAGWLVVAGAGAVGVGLVQLPNLEELMLDVGRALGPWTYLVVGILAFLETGAFVGLVAPGETTVIVGGVIAGQGEISLLVLIGVVWACAVAGDLASYTAGRKLGRAWLLRHGERLKITEDRLHKVEEFFERRGGTTILVGRFIGFVRALAPFIAGTSNMPLRRFLPYDVLGAGLWAATFSTLGYVFWQSFDRLTSYVSRGLFAFSTVVVVVAGIVFLIQLNRDPERREQVRAWLEEREDRPGWRPVVRLAGPAWRVVGRPAAMVADLGARFGWNRLTPGNLGLELTTLLALLAVGGFTFFVCGDIAAEAGVPRIDRIAADVAEELLRGLARRPGADRDVARRTPGRRRRGARHGALVGRPAAVAARRGARRRHGAHVRARPRHEGGLRPRPAVRPAHRRRPRGVPVRPHGVRRGVGRVRGGARPRGERLGGPFRGRDGGDRARGRGRRDPRLPARALPHGHHRRRRAGRGDLVARRHSCPRHGPRAPQCTSSRMIDDRVSLIVIGVTALISLTLWIALIAVPAWRSYWRLRERLLALVMSLYVLAAFVLAGALAGGVVLWYYDRL